MMDLEYRLYLIKEQIRIYFFWIITRFHKDDEEVPF